MQPNQIYKCFNPKDFFYIETNRQNHTQKVDVISTGK